MNENLIAKSAAQKLGNLLSLIKFSHSVFALPFALSMFIIATRGRTILVSQFLWIVLALISARSAAMAFNRLLDRYIDALNPRTANRELPSGKIGTGSVYLFLIFSSLIFHVSAWFLGAHCLVLAPLVLAFLFFYSWTKRFTNYSHLLLGVALGLAPGGVWYAVTATFAYQPLLMMIAVMFWVAGFDIIYSCQDVDFDRSSGLYSLPASLGVNRALQLAKLFHLLSIVFLVYFGIVSGFGHYYFIGLFIFSLVVASQHFLVSPDNLSKVNAAFFTRNGLASFIYLISVLSDAYL